MQVQTHLFGTIEVDPDTVISFPAGLTGFESSVRYKLVHEAAEGEPVSFTLQSVDNPSVAFQIIDPTAIGFQYELELSDAERAALKVEQPEDVAVMLLLFKQETAKQLGANVRAPLLINVKTRLGLQKVIGNCRPRITVSNLSSAVG
ncbi:flagellar assembly protein FliW [Azospira oryzae]|jgi:flagellar assembly factor FliW|uniref:Flagellar assembly factor FliW n=1 Tax=Azospira oryzae TaxID=146939 RepID=A0ABY0IS34_9RHOO|nr:flagellar assembly protein FliW [Azospira oryzae]MBP7489382.1 flagellar assembly protein FliW [Azospira sp.]RZT89892.1 flagellar assembly factor FliW [Azospira oryzae]TLS19728.1 MAG: flagellar biosynthesis protein FliW [Betaproteobacteria bacterium]